LVARPLASRFFLCTITQELHRRRRQCWQEFILAPIDLGQHLASAETSKANQPLKAQAQGCHVACQCQLHRLARQPIHLAVQQRQGGNLLGYVPKYWNKDLDEPLVGRLLVVPIKVAGELSSVEFIDEAGHKAALFGGAKARGFWAAQPLPDGDGAGITLLIAEGVATSLTAREATGFPVIAALSSGNLLAVAREMRKRYPAAVVGVLTDLIKTTGEPDPHAIEAARAVGGLLVLPDFGEDRPPGMKDINDMHQLQGRERSPSASAARLTLGNGGLGRQRMQPTRPTAWKPRCVAWPGSRRLSMTAYARPTPMRSGCAFRPWTPRSRKRAVNWPAALMAPKARLSCS
jgi:hypothetical protein